MTGGRGDVGHLIGLQLRHESIHCEVGPVVGDFGPDARRVHGEAHGSFERRRDLIEVEGGGVRRFAQPLDFEAPRDQLAPFRGVLSDHDVSRGGVRADPVSGVLVGAQGDLDPPVVAYFEAFFGDRRDQMARVVHAHLAGVHTEFDERGVAAGSDDPMGRRAVDEAVKISRVRGAALVLDHAPYHRGERGVFEVGELEMVLEADAQHAQQVAIGLGEGSLVPRCFGSPKDLTCLLERFAKLVPESARIRFGAI